MGVSEAADGRAAVLAIDGGNSKTDVALVSRDGTVLASLRGPGASQEDYGIDGAMRILGGLVREVTAKAGAAVDGLVARHTSACLAGCDLPSEEESLTAALRAQGWSVTALAMNDTFAVLRAGLPDAAAGMSGVAVTCGAGINCVAVAPDGRAFRYLALGELTGDWGGGWGLAKAIMWHAMRGSDGRGPQTALGAGVAAHLGLASVSDVTVAVHQGVLGEADLVAMAPPVLFQVAATGDAVARHLVARQAQEVCVMAVTAMRQLAMPAAGTVIVLGGGLLQAGDPLLSREVEACFAKDAPGAIIRVANVPPIAGAALLGLDHLGLGAESKQRLRQSFAAALPAGNRFAAFIPKRFRLAKTFHVYHRKKSSEVQKPSRWPEARKAACLGSREAERAPASEAASDGADRSPRLCVSTRRATDGLAARAAPVTPPQRGEPRRPGS